MPKDEDLKCQDEQDKDIADLDEPIKEKKDEDEVIPEPVYVKSNPKILPPLPDRLAKNKKDEEISDMFRIFNKVEISIHLLTTLSTMPMYVKFLKELCTKKVKYKDDAKFLLLERMYMR